MNDIQLCYRTDSLGETVLELSNILSQSVSSIMPRSASHLILALYASFVALGRRIMV